MDRLLLIVAIVLVAVGLIALLRRQLLWGTVLIITGVVIGPGWSRIFH
jgi:hypothetical protein